MNDEIKLNNIYICDGINQNVIGVIKITIIIFTQFNENELDVDGLNTLNRFIIINM